MKSKGKPQAAKPSPLPWAQMKLGQMEMAPAKQGEGGNVILSADGKAVGSVWSDGRPESYANAALIVRAVNAHAGLVDALTALANVAGERGMDRAVMSQLVAEARAALRAAGEAV